MKLFQFFLKMQEKRGVFKIEVEILGKDEQINLGECYKMHPVQIQNQIY